MSYARTAKLLVLATGLNLVEGVNYLLNGKEQTQFSPPINPGKPCSTAPGAANPCQGWTETDTAIVASVGGVLALGGGLYGLYRWWTAPQPVTLAPVNAGPVPAPSAPGSVSVVVEPVSYLPLNAGPTQGS